MMIHKIKCFLGNHNKVYFSHEYCENNNLMTGIFSPWKCSACNTESTKFTCPEIPMPKTKEPKT